MTIGSAMESFFDPGQAVDVGYTSTRDTEWKHSIREAVETHWKVYREFCPDLEFRDKAKSDFIGCIWQMHLTVLLIESGFQLVKTESEGPDICVLKDDKKIWIEAVAPNVGTGPDALQIQDGIPMSLPEEQIILRLSSALHDKMKQYEKWLAKGIVKSNEAFIIAVNAGRLSGADLFHHVSFMEKAVFALGQHGWNVEIGSGKVTGTFYRFRERIHKRSGSEVRTDGFLNGALPNLSGVIFSPDHFGNTYKMKGSDLIVIHNPGASYSFEKGLFRFGRERYVDEGRLCESDWRSEQAELSFLKRMLKLLRK